MALDNADARRQAVRERQARYDQAEERKEQRRLASSARSKAHKVVTTSKRFKEHSIEELITIARMRCGEDGVNYEAHREKIEAVLAILHGPQML